MKIYNVRKFTKDFRAFLIEFSKKENLFVHQDFVEKAIRIQSEEVEGETESYIDRIENSILEQIVSFYGDISFPQASGRERSYGDS
jgi:hypothetical protein